MSPNTVSYKALLSQRQYLKLIAANIVSRFGDSLDLIAFNWIMYQITKSASLIALITAVNFLPTIFIQPFAGVLVDRISKKRVMILCDVGRAAMVGLTVASYLLGWLNPGALIAITLINSTLEAFRIPAGSALVPKILSKEHYTTGTSLNQGISRVTEMVGTACAGGIIALLGSPAALLIDAATFLFSGVVIAFIHYEEELRKAALNVRSYFSELSEGFLALKQNRFLFCLILIGAFMNFSSSPFAFQTIYIAEDLGMGPEVLSLVGVALSGGMALGAFLTPRLQKRWSGRLLFVGVGVLEAAAFAELWLLPELQVLWLTVILLTAGFLVTGIAIGVQNVIFSAKFMSNVEPEMMGRLTGIVNAVLTCTIPAGSLICSALASFLPVPPIFLIFGFVSLAVYLIVAKAKVFREL